MKQISFRDREEKLHALAEVLGEFLRNSTVLDLGCDKRTLRSYVKSYIGIDISGKPDIIVNLEYGIPFKDQSVDIVVAMDVLEHLDEMHDTFDEMCRVARRYVVIGLPNLYEWSFRLKFLLGRRVSGKYGLPLEQPKDRHRWFFSLRDARKFVITRGELNGFRLKKEFYGYYRYGNMVARMVTWVGRIIGQIGDNLFVYHYLAILERHTTV